MSKILDGKVVATSIQNKLIKQLEGINKQLTLGILQIGDLPASNTYIKHKMAMAKKLNIEVDRQKIPSSISEHELIQKIESWNADKNINGLIVQLPLPDHLSSTKILSRISPDKDVDGLSPLNIGLLSAGKPYIIPATTKGIFQLLEYYGINPTGKHVVIVGRSALVGRPTALQFVNLDATVTITHSQTQDLASITRQADILLSAVGRPGIITSDLISNKSIIIDIGINRAENGLVGDVDFENVAPLVTAISPVPGGIGPLTVVCLFQNLVELYLRSQGK